TRPSWPRWASAWQCLRLRPRPHHAKAARAAADPLVVSQISPPVRIVLAAAIIFLAAWFTVLRPKSDSAVVPVATPVATPTATGPPARPPGSRGRKARGPRPHRRARVKGPQRRDHAAAGPAGHRHEVVPGAGPAARGDPGAGAGQASARRLRRAE